MNRILFDYTYYQSGSRFHGGGEYGDIVLESLLSFKWDKSTMPGIFYRRDRRVNTQLLEKVRASGWNLHPIRECRNLPHIIKEYGYNTIYSALPYVFDWGNCYNYPSNIRFVGTFHGFRNIELANYEEMESGISTFKRDKISERKMYYQKAFQTFKNTEIVVVSTHSKFSLMHYFPEITAQKIHVLYSPLKRTSIEDNPVAEECFLKKCGVNPGEFGLMVSANHWYKNIKRGMLAYDLVFDGRYDFISDNYKVLVLGGMNNKEELLEGIKNANRFVFLDYIEIDKLEVLYKNAHLFLYPTLNEGFGYPPLEAMKYGTVCACSANTSVSEICQEMVWYFNPLDIDEIAIRILTSFSAEERKIKKSAIKQKLKGVFDKQESDLQKLMDLLVNG